MPYERSAKYYDAIYAAAGKDYAAEASVVRDLIESHKRSSGNTLLDVGCGTGKHLEHLRRWFDVEGLDANAAMLEIARRRLPGIRLHRADMLDFHLDRRFDALTCLFGAIGHATPATQMRRAVLTVARHLRPGGVLLLEPWISPEAWSGHRVDSDFVDEPELKIARINTVDRRDDVSILDMHYLAGTPERIEYFTERLELGLYSRDQYESALRDAGLATAFDTAGLIGRGLHIGVVPP